MISAPRAVVSNDGGSFKGSSSASSALTLSLNGLIATGGGNIAAPIKSERIKIS